MWISSIGWDWCGQVQNIALFGWTENSSKLWLRRLGHISIERMKRLVNDGVLTRIFGKVATADQAPKEVAELKDAPPELEDGGQATVDELV